MIKKILFLYTTLIGGLANAQSLDSLIKDYDPSQINFIKEHWCQYFKDDLAQLYKTKNLYSIRLDSYGLIYPSKDIFTNVSTDNMRRNGQRSTANTKYSIAHIFRKYPAKLQKHTSGDVDDETLFYDSLIDAIHNNKELDLLEFNDKWRSVNNARTILEINTLIASKGYNKVIFYCHGYNVPYSLAALQFEYIIESFHLDDGKTLFIPIYWPSNDAKKFEQNKNGTLNYDDRKSPRNAARFLYYSNQAYFAGLTLRAIINGLAEINGLGESVSIKIVSHSLGVTVATTALINTKSKLHIHKRQPINDQLEKLMDNTPIPDRQISVYMSAAAIPGICTFQDIDLLKAKKFKFYCSWNENDHVLQKNFLHIKVGPNKLGGTELGLNANQSVENVGSYLNSNASGSFQAKNVTAQSDHDIFSYLKNSDYKNFMSVFFSH
jgi:hypothetical protein